MLLERWTKYCLLVSPRKFKQKAAISTLIDKPLKLVDKFPYLGSNISSIESDVHIRLAKAWNAIERLSITWKSDLSDKKNSEISPKL